MADYTPFKKGCKRDFDDILKEVARKVRMNSEIDTLGRKLGFDLNDIHGYITTNNKTQTVTYDGTLQMLRDWRKLQKESTERSSLKTALEQAGQIHLADDLLPSYLSSDTEEMESMRLAGKISSTDYLRCGSDDEGDFDEILKRIARLMRGNQAIDDLGKALGFQPADIDRYKQTNTLHGNVTYDGTLKMLRDWREKQTEADERSALRNALSKAYQRHLADTCFPSSTLDNFIERVAKETKEYYLTDMCTIQADPLDDETIFNFGDIFTNLTLLEVEKNWHITRKSPLSFSDLLKIKICGLPAKRLLVEGEGGVGKTTFCTKIAWDWAQGIGFQQFKLVVVIFLRKAKNKTVGEVVKSYLPDSNPVEARQIDEYILSNPEDVFLVLDGLDEFDGDFSGQIFKIIFNLVFRSGTVLVTTRQWKVHLIRSGADLKRIYAYIAIEGFSAENLSSYIGKFFRPDTQSPKDLISFMNDNDVVRENMAPFPLYVAMLCIMWREYDDQRREEMARLKTFSQLFHEMIDFLVDHYLPKETKSHTVLGRRRETISPHLTKIGKIAFKGLLDKRLVFPEDAFQACSDSMEVGCKVGVLTREKHAATKRERRNNPRTEVSNVQFPHKLFQEYLSAVYLSSLHGSDGSRYKKEMAKITDSAYEFKYLLYFTAALKKEVGLDIVRRLLANRTGGHFIVDVAYESQNQSVAEEVGKQLVKSGSKLEIVPDMSPHTISGHIFILKHGVDVKGLAVKTSCGKSVSQELAEFICSSPSLRNLEIGSGPVRTRSFRQFQASILPDVFYSRLADEAANAKIEDLKVYSADLESRRSASYGLGCFVCKMPHLRSLEFYDTKFKTSFFNTSANHGLKQFSVDDRTLSRWQKKRLRFDSVEEITVNVTDDVYSDVSEELHGLQGVRELTIQRHECVSEFCALEEPEKLLGILLTAFPTLTKMTFRDIVIGNGVVKSMVEKIRVAGHPNFKIFEFIRCDTDDDLIVQQVNCQVVVEHGEPRDHIPERRRSRFVLEQPAEVPVDEANTCCSSREGIFRRLRGCLSTLSNLLSPLLGLHEMQDSEGSADTLDLI